MPYIIPNPLPISCTDCHRLMRVEFQTHETHNDTVLVAAECDCGRLFGVVDALLLHHLVQRGQPLIAQTLKHDPTLGNHAKERVQALRARMAEYERWIAAATWAQEKPRP